jgi:predicted DNA-binding transcriptional regulator AlpA
MGEGGPKSGKLGRRVVYRRADVEAWIAAAFDATGS